MYLIGQAVLSRGVTFAGQLVVAWFINPELMGVFAKAMGITAIFTFVQNLGVRDVLIKRYRRFDRWSGPAFWLCLSSGGLACLVLLGLAQPLSLLMNEPRCASLIAILSLAMPFNAIANVPRARLGGALKFRDTALVELATSLGTQALTMLMAFAGAGAFALAVPRTVVAVATCGWLFQIAPVQIRSRHLWRRGRMLLLDSGVISLTLIFSLLISNGDYLILSFLRGPVENGLYYFAFGLSTQAVMVIGIQVSSLVFPALSSIKEADHQIELFRRGLPLLMYGVGFAAFLQASLATPFFSAFISDEYAPSAPLMQILCLGMAWRPIGWAAGSLMHAQGRFIAKLKLVAVDVVMFLCFAATGAWLGGAFGLAVSVTIFAICETVLLITGGCWNVAGSTKACLESLVRPIAVLATSFVPLLIVLAYLQSDSFIQNTTQIVASTVVMTGLFVTNVYLFDRATFDHFQNRLRRLRST